MSDSESMQQRFFGHDKYDKCCKTLNFEYYGRKLRQNDWTIPTSNHAKFAPVILLGLEFFFSGEFGEEEKHRVDIGRPH